MRHMLWVLWLLGAGLANSQLYASDSHRVLVVSATGRLSHSPCELRLIDIQTEQVVARAEVGATAEAVLADRGDLLAVVSQYQVEGVNQPRARLEIFRARDLLLLEAGALPVERNTYMEVPSRATLRFSPDNQQLVVQHMTSYLNEDRPHGHTVDDVVLTRLRRDLDDLGRFQIIGPPLKIPRARVLDILYTADWPRISVWNSHLGAIEVLDLVRTEILERVMVGDDPYLSTLDPSFLEEPNIGQLILRLSLQGSMVTQNSRYAYYIPQHRAKPRQPTFLGHLRRVDLAAEPPNIVGISEEVQPNLRAKVATVSESARALFVAEQRLADNGFSQLPSPRIKVFHLTLQPAGDIELSLTDCDFLTASTDGRYLYALDFAGAMAVIDIASRREVKILENVGTHPALAFPLPNDDPG